MLVHLNWHEKSRGCEERKEAMRQTNEQNVKAQGAIRKTFGVADVQHHGIFPRSVSLT
jgi:hypothetical protein